MKYLLTILAAIGIAANVAAQQNIISLKECLETGLKQNYDILISRNEQRISENNATAANAGMLPTLALSAGYMTSADRTDTTPREGDKVVDAAAFDQTVDVGLSLNWTLFNGMSVRANYNKLRELEQMGELKTRLTIEDFVANLTAEYYNLIQQTLRLKNFRYAVSLSRERLRITEARYQIGDFSRLDL